VGQLNDALGDGAELTEARAGDMQETGEVNWAFKHV
jgi:hypothetical protein